MSMAEITRAAAALLLGATLANAQLTIYVDVNNACPGGGFQSDPFCSIQTAIDVASDGDEVVVAPGTYFERIDFLGKAIAVRGTEGADVTTIDAGGSGSVVTCDNAESADTVLEGFTISGGDSLNGGGMYNSGSSPTVADCMFTANTTNDTGGGMYNTGNSSPTLTHCVFTGNSALDGGGMYNIYSNSNPTLTNCVFSGNTATGTPARGGGMYNERSSPTLTGCTVIGNTPDGMHTWLGGSPTIDNSVFWGNALAQITTVAGSPVTVSFSDVQGGLPDGTVDGGGNISDDPEFIDGFHLSETSPCIDRGDPDFVPVPDETDIDGDPRVINARVDMGADEYAGDFGVCGNGVVEAGEDCDPPDGVTCDEGCHLMPDEDVDDDGVLNDDDVCDNTPPDTPVDAEGRPLGDIDLDCDVDLLDFGLFQDSFTGVLE